MNKNTSKHFKTLQSALVTISLSLGFVLPVHAQLDSSGIYKAPISSTAAISATLKAKLKDTYLVMFKEPKRGQQPFIQAPNKLNVTGTSTASTTFTSNSTWQEKQYIVDQLHLDGEIISVYNALNGIHVRMSEEEASRLSRDKRVSSVSENSISTISNHPSPSWGLDRMDDPVPNVDGSYSTNNTGAGQTIYILDSGLNLHEPAVAAEFGGRASVFWDVNGQGGRDGNGHGSMVASAAAGKTYGVAKGAKLIIAKVTDGNTGNSQNSTHVLAFNWLATNAPAGSIVNWSHGYTNKRRDSEGELVYYCGRGVKVPALERAIKKAHDAGIIVVVAAGNDGCNTAKYTPTNIPETFVVGGTSRLGFPNSDRKYDGSRTGWDIDAFAPGESVSVMGPYGNRVVVNGTSISAPYISGVFAVACQAAGTLCKSGNTASLYNALKGTGTLGTVTNTNGTPLTGATSRFITAQW